MFAKFDDQRGMENESLLIYCAEPPTYQKENQEVKKRGNRLSFDSKRSLQGINGKVLRKS